MSAEQMPAGSLLAHRALDKAANVVVDHVKRCLADNERILITGDPDLASSDAVYHEVQNGYERLLVAAARILEPGGDDDDEDDEDGPPPGNAGVTPALDGLGTALPSLASLVAPIRVTPTPVPTVDTTAAMGLVSALLTGAGRTVQLDGFRPVPQGRILRLDRRLLDQRAALGVAKLDYEQQQSQAEARLTEATARIEELESEIAGAGSSGSDRHELETDLEDELEVRDEAAADARRATVLVGLISELLAAIDAFTAAVHTATPDSSRSPYIEASLREQLHGPKAGGLATARRFGKVLFVNAVSGSADQVSSDQRSKDRLHTMASLSLSYYLLDVDSGNVITGGLVTGTAQATGKVGERFTISVDVQ